jgi:heme O synthase-like polyprenyltransferase
MFIEIAQAGGIITNAPRFSQVLANAFNFLLSIFGMLAIIGMITAGVIYLASGGNENRTQTAKRAFLYSIAGIAVTLAAMVIIRTIDSLIR